MAETDEIYNKRFAKKIDKPVTNETIDIIVSQASTRYFLDKPISDNDLEAILIAAASAPTSSNMHSWSCVVVKDKDKMKELQPLCGGQEFLPKAAMQIFWIADLSKNASIAKSFGKTPENIKTVEAFLTAAIDATLAAQNASLAAQSLGIGTTYIGGARNKPLELAKALNLPKYSFVVFAMVFGYSAKEKQIRPRPDLKATVHFEKYTPQSQDAYNETINQWFKDLGREFNWNEYVAANISNPEALAGRDNLRAYLKELGFDLN